MRKFLLACCLPIAPSALAQDDERFIPFWVNVTVNDEPSDTCVVTPFQDNVTVGALPASMHSVSKLALVADTYFTIRIAKAGYREKLLAVDTHLPETIEGLDDIVYTVALE